MPEDLHVADVLGCEEKYGGEGEVTTEESSSFFIITHVDSEMQNIQLVYSLRYFYWLATSECPCLLEASTILIHSAFHFTLLR